MCGRGGDRSVIPRIVDGRGRGGVLLGAVVAVGIVPIVVRLLRGPLDVVPVPSTPAILYIPHRNLLAVSLILDSREGGRVGGAGMMVDGGFAK